MIEYYNIYQYITIYYNYIQLLHIYSVLTFADGEVPESLAEKTDSGPHEPQAPAVALAGSGC